MGKFDYPRTHALLGVLEDRIEVVGKITFEEFMDIVLYHPRLGYYMNLDREPWRDYITSPEMHPFFGFLMARQIHEFFQLLGEPRCFQVVEVGVGRGSLASQIIHEIEASYPLLFQRLQYFLNDISPLARRTQRILLDKWIERGKVCLIEVNELPPITGCIINNELLDSFPVRRMAMTEEGLREIFVKLVNKQLTETLGPPSSSEVSRYFKTLKVKLLDDVKAEVNLQATRWLKSIAKKLKKGFIVTVDYGDEAPLLYGKPRREGTLLCYHNGAICPNPFIRLGYQDITSHVDFTNLVNEGRKAGLKMGGFTTQRNFLLNLGLLEMLHNYDVEASPSIKEYLANVAILGKLVDKEGLGKLKNLIQYKGLRNPKLALTGLRRRVESEEARLLGEPFKMLERKLRS